MMNLLPSTPTLLLITALTHINSSLATDRFVSLVGGNTPPFVSWTDAATNIQDAIDAASAGDVIWVTNGVYAAGGKPMGGGVTNRVTLDKPVHVQSVNGAVATTIMGAWDPSSTNGPLAVRCAWLTNGAVLSGFTLRGGATANSQDNGGGVLGASTNAFVSECLLIGNAAGMWGGGAYKTTLNDCVISNNIAVGRTGSSPSGGGAAFCALGNCLLVGNSALMSGGGAYSSTLRNCGIAKNWARNLGAGVDSSTLINCSVAANLVGDSTYGDAGGASNTSLTNCIVYGNTTSQNRSSSNYLNCTFGFSCAAPLAPGVGNLALDPQLLADAVHLSASSPCRGAGSTNLVSGTDIDGQPWANPPSIGCDEWQPVPVVAAQLSYQINWPAHGLTFNVAAAGQPPFDYFWSKDGAALQDDGHHSNSDTPNLVVNSFGPEDAGLYSVVISNTFGVVTSQVAQVVIHAVDAAGANPVAPYSTWSAAATNIQDAIEASAAGDIVLVTNGLYAFGGKVKAGDLTNRVALDKPITVTSVNGYAKTIIQGAWDSVSKNGPGAARCAWLADGAALSGFTLQNGATRSSGDQTTLQSGGGVWCVSTNGTVSNCVLTNNTAIYGAGISYGTLNNSLVTLNLASFGGGGAYSATLNNCTVQFNYTTNPSFNRGAGTYNGIIRNSIVVGNYDNYPAAFNLDNYSSDLGPNYAQYYYCCTAPAGFSSLMPFGPGNLNAASLNLLFLDSFHLAYASPCRGAGNALYSTGTDLDGEPWQNPPSMGCDELILSNFVGALSVSVQANYTSLLINRFGSFLGAINGKASSVSWSFGDGSTLTNSAARAAHQWTTPGAYTVTFTAYNLDNPEGVFATTLVHVTTLSAPQLETFSLQSNGYYFQFTGQPTASYTVQYATNLLAPISWQTLNYYYSSGGTQQVTDPGALTNASRFYRVLAN